MLTTLVEMAEAAKTAALAAAVEATTVATNAEAAAVSLAEADAMVVAKCADADELITTMHIFDADEYKAKLVARLAAEEAADAVRVAEACATAVAAAAATKAVAVAAAVVVAAAASAMVALNQINSNFGTARSGKNCSAVKRSGRSEWRA